MRRIKLGILQTNHDKSVEVGDAYPDDAHRFRDLFNAHEIRFEYKVYSSESNLLSGKHFFKAWDTVEDKRLVNFTYPIEDVISWSILTYKDLQAKIIAETFNLNESDVLLVEGV